MRRPDETIQLIAAKLEIEEQTVRSVVNEWELRRAERRAHWRRHHYYCDDPVFCVCDMGRAWPL